MSTYNNKYDILGSTIKPNPASVKYWADLASNQNGGDLKYFNGKDWVYVNSKATGDITELKEDVKQLQTDVKNKVDKVSGKDLSTNDYTTEEKTKLASLTNYNDSEVRELIKNKVDKVSGKDLSTNDYTTEEKTKLASLTNYNDSEVRELITALTLKVNGLEDRVAALETPTV